MKRGDICHLPRCRSTLTITTDGNGNTIAICPPCERNKAGRCRGCPAKITQNTHGGALKMWCPACLKRRDAERHTARYRMERERLLAIKRRSDAKPDVRARRLERARKYYEAHPYESDPLSRLYHRERARVRLSNPVVRARVNARRRELAALRRQQVAA